VASGRRTGGGGDELPGDGAPSGPGGAARAARLLQVGCFTSSFDRFSVAPLLVLIAADLDVPTSAAAQVATAYFLTYGLMQAVWAAVSDRLGRVRTLRLAFAVAGATGLASAAAPSLGLLLVARALAGAAFAAAVPGALVYTGDTVPPHARQSALADLMTGAALGMALSTAGAAAIGQYLHWRWAFGVAALIALGLAWRLRVLPEPPRAVPTRFDRAVREVLRDRWAVLVLALAFAEGMVLVGFVTYFPLTLQEGGLSTTAAGSAVTAFGISTMLFARLVKSLSRRTSAARLSGIGAVCAVLAYGAAAADPALPGVLAACLLLGAARAFLHSTLQAWVTDVVPGQRATAVSLFSTLMFTGSAAATAVGAPYVDGGRFVAVYVLALALTVPLGVTATVGRARYARR